MLMFDSPARIDTNLDSRSISFENPRGERGAGGSTANGRKGSPNKWISPGEKVVLADIQGAGRIRHFWMTFMADIPEEMRAVWMEVYYDDLDSPSISVPCLDFFGLPHGRPVAYYSALTSVQEAHGFNAYFPMPFRKRIRMELTNSGSKAINLYYQVDYTLEPFDPQEGYLHVTFNRENLTTLKRDFTIAAGLHGPGRFLGSSIGIRVQQDGMLWFGEGEFKVYRDGDTQLPTICGTGLEDYLGSAWGLAGQHTALYSGLPSYVAAPRKESGPPSMEEVLNAPMPDFVGFYRWHIPDPIIFKESFRATIQQIGVVIGTGEKARDAQKKYTPAGFGWATPGAKNWAAFIGPGEHKEMPPDFLIGIAERRDDYSAAAFLYCREAQPVPRLKIDQATADIGLRTYEKAPPRLF